MQKFVIKNRRKRKYIRKGEKTPISSSSKTVYGILPLLIMSIAFMTTMIISTPFRNSLSNFKFTIQLPQLSLNNPILFFQSLIFNIAQVGVICEAIVVSIWENIIHIFETIIYTATQDFTILNPLPILKIIENNLITTGNFLLYLAQLIREGQLITYKITIQLLFFTFSFAQTEINFLTLIIIHAVIFIGQFTVAVAGILWQTIIASALFITQVITTASIVVFQVFIELMIFLSKVILSATIVIGTWIISIINTITFTINNVVNSVIHTIEIPFNVFGAFGIQMKPYVDFFGHHVEMTGQDFDKGLNDLGQFTSYMSSAK